MTSEEVEANNDGRKKCAEVRNAAAAENWTIACFLNDLNHVFVTP